MSQKVLGRPVDRKKMEQTEEICVGTAITLSTFQLFHWFYAEILSLADFRVY